MTSHLSLSHHPLVEALPLRLPEVDDARAVRLIYDNNPMPEMCGKVCTRECENVCSMGLQGEPVAIRWLKRYATERFDDLKAVLEPATTDVGRGHCDFQ